VSFDLNCASIPLVLSGNVRVADWKGGEVVER